jgi:hypothetical protein
MLVTLLYKPGNSNRSIPVFSCYHLFNSSDVHPFSPLPLLPTLKMSQLGLSFNSTVIFAHDAWSGYLSEAQRFFPNSASRVALLVFINIPLIVVLLNVLRQLVSSRASLPTLCH